MSGYVYFLNIEGTDIYKIGLTRYDSDKRINSLKTKFKTLNLIELVRVIPPDYSNVDSLEKLLHKVFMTGHIINEWFIICLEKELIKQIAIGSSKTCKKFPSNIKKTIHIDYSYNSLWSLQNYQEPMQNKIVKCKTTENKQYCENMKKFRLLFKDKKGYS